MQLESFAPVVNKDSTILIVGSMPGGQSLQMQQYYGNPRNHFWSIMYALYEEPVPRDYEERLAFLLSKRIALWDVLHRCNRQGSLDTNIKDEEVNDFAGFYRQYDSIKAVLFNGTKAGSVYRKRVASQADKHYALLPSSSPVPGKYNKSLEEKIEAWRVITRL